MKEKTMRTFIIISIFIVIALAGLGIVYSLDLISATELQDYATKSVSLGAIIGLASIIIATLLSFKMKK